MSKLTLYGIWLSGPTYEAGLALSLMGQSFAYKHVAIRPTEHDGVFDMIFRHVTFKTINFHQIS